jgi:hypothetical protein
LQTISVIPFTDAANPVSRTVGSLYPDSVFNLYVRGVNTDSNAGSNASLLNVSTTNLARSLTTLPSVTFSNRYYSATVKRLLDNATIGNLINSTTDWNSDSFVAPIHRINNRGSSSNNLMYISTTFVSDGTTAAGPLVNYNGYPATKPANVTLSNIQITTYTPVDAYTATQDIGF